MKKALRFRQHIRTSSRMRRGYCTYQYTGTIGDATDDALSVHGAYQSTAYPDMASLKPEDRPELFLFYNLGTEKVVCKSVYIGPDLHSFPPKPGNYIAHALLIAASERFNPVEIYEKAAWKSPRQVAAEDASDPVSEEIPELALETDPGFYDESWFVHLLTTEGQEARRNMFMVVVDAVLRRRKVIIIDRKERLLPWTMCLLQVFPLEFVFRHLTIASFANSQTLLDVCQVLCFETENAAHAVEMGGQADLDIIDIDHPPQHEPSFYARTLTDAILKNDFARFRKEVLQRIATDFAPEHFDKHAYYYDRFSKIASMSPEDFEAFFNTQSGDVRYVEEIIGEVIQHKLKGHCEIVWRMLLEKDPPLANDLRSYCLAGRCTLAGETDALWIEFEGKTAAALDFDTLVQVQDFFAVTALQDSRRDTAFYDSVMRVVKWCTDGEIKKKGVALIRAFAPRGLDDGRMKELARLQGHLDLLDTVDRSSAAERYHTFEDQYTSMTEDERSDLVRRLEPVEWETFFQWLADDKPFLISLYQKQKLSKLLPERKLASGLLRNDDPADLVRMIKQLPESDREQFFQHITPALRAGLTMYADQRMIGELSPVDQARYHLQKNGITLEFLYSFVRLPWTHDAWQAVFILLDRSNKERIPALLKQVIQGKRPDTPVQVNYSTLQWQYILYQYYVFLITADEYRYFETLSREIPLSWEDYDIIEHFLVPLLPGPNATVDRFNRPDNSRKVMMMETSGPQWKRS